MKKKLIQISITSFLAIFSFFYTNKVIELIRQTDPLMKQIKSTENKFKINPIEPTIKENTIIPGLEGTNIDYEETYNNMKDYGTYNEVLTVLKEVKPTISLDEYYDKYIISGNNSKNEVALVFEINKNIDIQKLINIYNILKVNNTQATFFVDGMFLEKYLSQIKEMNKIQLEPLSYNDNYEEIYFNTTISLINDITGIKPKYCYSTYDRKEVQQTCQKNNMHTIIPSINTKNYPYNSIKQKLTNGAIIGLKVSTSTEIELPTIIDYINQKGYKLVILDQLLSEVNNK